MQQASLAPSSSSSSSSSSTTPPAGTNYQIASVIINEAAVTSLEFHKSGNFLVSVTRDSAINLVDCLTGLVRKKVYAKTTGIGDIKFTHHESCVLMTAAQKSSDVRYMCMHDNVVIRVFKGPEHVPVTSLAINPIDDQFLTASSYSVHLWSLGLPKPVGKLTLPPYSDQVSVAYDNAANIIGVSCTDGNTRARSIKLYDVRNMEQGPFMDLAPSVDNLVAAMGPVAALPPGHLQQQAQRILTSTWTGLEFSADGLHMLVNTTETLLVIDAFKEGVPPVVIPKKNEAGISLGACMSADAKYVLSGTDDNELAVYDKKTGALCNTLTGHVAPVDCVKCNPRLDMWASGCVNTALWLRPSQ